MRFTAGVDDFNAEFMTENTWVIEKRLFAGERVKISSADPDAVNPDECLAGCWPWFGCVGCGKFAGLIERDLEHDGETV